jgi:lipoprotein NlpI
MTTIVLIVLLVSCSNGPPPNLGAVRCDESVKHDPGHAIDDCTRAIQSGQLNSHELAISYFNRGYALLNYKEDYDRATADFDEAIRLDPSMPIAYDERGTAHFARGELDEAIADDDEAIRLDPKYAIGHTNRGVSWYAKGDKLRALADFDEALRLDPNDLQAQTARGYLRFDMGDFAGAVSDLQRSAQQRPDPHPVLWLYLARTRLGQDGTAELTANAARAKTHPWAPAVIELFLGQRAPDSIPTDVQVGDDGCNVPFYVGEWQLKQGNRAAAIAGLRRTVETCPKSYVVYRGALAELARLGQHQ